MPLTDEQKKVRQKHFPGRRGFLPPDQMELFRQYCQEAGCPLEEGVFKRPRNSPAVKEEAPEWVPGMTVLPRQRKAKRKTDSYYGSLDSSEVGEGASYGHAAAAAAAAAGELHHGQDRSLGAARLAANGGEHREIGLRLGDAEADSGSSGEDLSHKHPRLGGLPHAAHSQLNLRQLHQQQQHMDGHAHGLLDPAAAAAVGAAHGDAVGALGSPQRSIQLPGGTAAAAAAAADDAAADAAGVDTVHPAARPPTGLHTRVASSYDDAGDDEQQQQQQQQQQQEAARAGGLDEGPSHADVIKGLIDLRSAHAAHPAASVPTSAAAAAAGSGDLDFASLEDFEHHHQQQQQEEQQQQHYAPLLTVSTGRGRGGRPRGRPPSRGRGRGRGRVKRDSEPFPVGSPLHPVAPLQYHNSAPLYHSSGGGLAAAAAAAHHHHYPGAFGSLGGGGGQGQSTLARLTHAAAMAEGMGTRGDRSRPDDYYQVYTEYFTAQEAYQRLMSSLAANPMLHLVPEPEMPESLYGPAYAGRVQDSANMLAAAAAIDLLSPGALSASRRKRQHSGSGNNKPAAAGAAAGTAAAAGAAAGAVTAGAAGAAADHMELDHHEQDHRQPAERDTVPAAAAAGAGSRGPIRPETDRIPAAAKEAAAVLAVMEARVLANGLGGREAGEGDGEGEDAGDAAAAADGVGLDLQVQDDDFLDDDS